MAVPSTMIGLLMMLPNDDEDRVSFKLGVAAAFFFLRFMRRQATTTARIIAAIAPATTPPMTAAEGPPPVWLLSTVPGPPTAGFAVSVGSELLVVARDEMLL